MNTSLTCGSPLSLVSMSETWAVPPFMAPVIAEPVTVTGPGAHAPAATTSPDGITLPS